MEPHTVSTVTLQVAPREFTDGLHLKFEDRDGVFAEGVLAYQLVDGELRTGELTWSDGISRAPEVLS